MRPWKQYYSTVFLNFSEPRCWTHSTSLGSLTSAPAKGHAQWLASEKNRPYGGITFNDQHSARLLAYLEKTILSKMTVTGDSLFDVRFANAVAGERTASSSSVAAAKPKPKPKPQPQPAPASDPFPDESHEAQLSGDDH